MTDQAEDLDHLVRGSWTPSGAADAGLPAHAAKWLRARTGLAERSTPAAPDSALHVPESTLSPDARALLSNVVGDAGVHIGRSERLGRAGGLSYLDLLRHRGNGDIAVPDAVVVPADHDEVQRVVEVCSEHRIGIVPFGGGTSVVGGVTALRGKLDAVVALDLHRLDELVSIDPVSRIAVLQAGLTAPHAERLLAAHGFTLGHVPQSFERATIGGFAATRSSGQASAGYGRFEDMVAGVRLAAPRGEWRLGVAPASAAGPDLRHLVIGSEGTLGVITEVALRVRPLPEVDRYEGYVLDGWDKGAEVVRTLAQQRVPVTVMRLSDSTETEVALALKGGWKTVALRRYLAARGIAEPCLLVLGWEAGSTGELSQRRAATLRALRSTGAVRLGKAAGEAWRHGRFAGPRQRDALMDAGVCVETLETAAYWSTLSELRTTVRGALADSLTGPGVRPIVACHISHSYETGASLYFTVIVPRDLDDPTGQWQRAKAAACQAIGSLGTITHHHAVGTDHAPYLAAEIGHLGVDVLASLKRTLDPNGVLNPGKLIS
ncbi:alkyldihydroxyacetonephosphate synthase [Herbihabitans rhizosphaerae]|uniref:Alkyldihydroxyacetonephosphate synthase n=1 Tax=Herbihabitans rhizosphaerae TaxID=1872711 RepID=A0A4Q7KY56_9PSEU|nr:FAD-binding oxidoreductase [Herbihabitans rhizosphaerae]RZS40951.1 alkyldihydroxyacetonephosphate synthase [Herbihabitans rhizosphaerae]